jgi:hypothetical protein
LVKRYFLLDIQPGFHVKTEEGWRLAAPPTKSQLEYLEALGLTPRVFTDP